MDSFKNHPKSVAEIRATKANDGRLWSPRDALISMLRDLDSGVCVPEAVAICYRVRDKDDPEVVHVSYEVAGSASRHDAIGMLEAAKGCMLGWNRA